MQQVCSTKYALGVFFFVLALAGTSAAQAEEPENSASDAAALASQDNFAQILAHREVANRLAINPESLMRQVDLLHARCAPCNPSTQHDILLRQK